MPHACFYGRRHRHFYVEVVKSGLIIDVQFYLVLVVILMCRIQVLMLLSVESRTVLSDKVVTSDCSTLIKNEIK